jgi:hypothetical protein
MTMDLFLTKEVAALIVVPQIHGYTTKSMFTKQKLNDVVLHKQGITLHFLAGGVVVACIKH